MKYFAIFLIMIITMFMVHNDAFADSSSNVYQIPNVDFDKYSYTWGEQGKLFMMSPLDNQDPQRIEVITANNSTFKSQIHVYPDSTIQENFVLTETGPDTGLFEWTFTITDPETKEAYDINSNYIIVSNSTEHINYQFDVDPNAGYSTTAKITYPDDNTLPSDEQRQRVHSQYPSIQFRNANLTSPYDGHGIVTVHYPTQNKSPIDVDQLKTVFSAYDANRIFEILKETGPDTGIFEGELSFSSYPSFSKIYMKKDETNARSISVYYLVSDSISSISTRSNSILLHHELEYDSKHQVHYDSDLSVHSDRKAYLDEQTIQVSGIANPNETVNVSLLSNRGSQLLFNKIHADANGEFETEFSWDDSPPSGIYTIQAVSIKNDSQVTNQITITSIEDLESRSIAIPPKQQFEMSIEPDQIVCKQVWKLILKPGGDIPSCVKLPTYTKLLERGWTPVSEN